MTSDIHARLFYVAFILLMAGVLAGGYTCYRYTRPFYPAPGTDVFELVEGVWVWTTSDSGCAGETHRIEFSADHKVMTIVGSRPFKGIHGNFDSIYVYDILDSTTNSVRGAIRGENRLTADSVPVVWDLVLRSPNRYAWHRTDWPSASRTPPIDRCP